MKNINKTAREFLDTINAIDRDTEGWKNYETLLAARGLAFMYNSAIKDAAQAVRDNMGCAHGKGPFKKCACPMELEDRIKALKLKV